MLSWQTILFLVAGVAAVVIIALLLARVDDYQRRSSIPLNDLPVIDLDATVAAGDLGIVYLPGEVSPTTTFPATPTAAASVETEILQVTPTIPAAPDCKSPRNWIQYTVLPGDTLPKLARAHQTDAIYILKANCLQNLELEIGTKIFLPAFPPMRPHSPGDIPNPLHWPDNSVQPAFPSWPIATPTFAPPSQ